MSDLDEPKSSNIEQSFAAQIATKAARKSHARRSTQSVWFGLGMMGLIGWSVVVPTLIGAAIGIWLDAKYSGRHPWTLALLIAGLSLGCLNAWRWIASENSAMREEEKDHHE